MNVWRWLGISIFLITTIGLVGSTEFAAFAKGKADTKIDVSADPDKATVKPGDGKTVDLKFKRGTDATKDIALTVAVEPKDKGVTAKVDPKVDAKASAAKLTVTTTDKADGNYKITVTAKSEGSKDATATFTLTAKKGDVAKVEPPKKGDLKFKALEKASGPFFTEQLTETEQTMTVMGQAVVQKQKQTFLIKWTPLDTDKDKNYVVEQQIMGVKMEIDIGGNKISYDSTNPNKQKNPMTDFFDQLTKNKLTYHVKTDLSKVESIDGRKAFVDGLKEINPQMQTLLNHILSDKSLQKMAEPTWFAYPPGGVIPESKTWKRDSNLDLGPIGKYATTFDFTLLKTEGAKDTIGVKSTLTYTPPTDKAGLPFIIQKADLKTSGGTGTAIFDRTKGRFDSSEIKMDLTGTLEIEVANMKTTVSLSQKQTAKSTTYDTAPAGWSVK